MKAKMGYWQSVVWVAENDEPNIIDREEISGFISTQLVADIFGKEANEVAFDIYMYRTGARNKWTAIFGGKIK